MNCSWSTIQSAQKLKSKQPLSSMATPSHPQLLNNVMYMCVSLQCHDCGLSSYRAAVRELIPQLELIDGVRIV